MLVVRIGILVFQTSIADRRLRYCLSAIVVGLKAGVVACDRSAADKAINLCCVGCCSYQGLFFQLLLLLVAEVLHSLCLIAFIL